MEKNTEPRNISIHLQSLTKVPKSCSGKRTISSISVAGETEYPHVELNCIFAAFIKNQLKIKT
jgi:hypothetical protein